VFSAKGAGSFKPGATPQGKVVFQKASAESANQWSRSFNPKRSARRNHTVFAQQLAVLLLKRASAMVLLLRLDVLQHRIELTRAHRKRPYPRCQKKPRY
jgi:hypothetical protein